jgi:FkbM family methyltransferase
MMLHDGYYWPAGDDHCHKVIHGETGDIDEALAFVTGFDVAVQAGGNVGVWATLMAKQFETVWTFEPDPANYACLVENVPSNVRHMNAGLGDKAERVGMKLFPDNCGAHYVNGSGKIEIITLDSLSLPACDYLCLDVEGYEPKALHGAAETITRFRPVIQMEEKGLSEKYYGIRAGAAERWLVREHGYRIAKRVRKDVILVPN